MAAQRLAEAGHRVRLFEAQATVGRKFLVAGHGGFNLSNSEELAGFTSRYGAEQTRFAALLHHFSPKDLRAWTADLGIETFVGTSGRIFPVSAHKPADLLRAWLDRLRALGVEIFTRHRWSTDWWHAHRRFRCRKCGSKDIKLDADFYGHAVRRQ